MGEPGIGFTKKAGFGPINPQSAGRWQATGRRPGRVQIRPQWPPAARGCRWPSVLPPCLPAHRQACGGQVGIACRVPARAWCQVLPRGCAGALEYRHASKALGQLLCCHQPVGLHLGGAGAQQARSFQGMGREDGGLTAPAPAFQGCWKDSDEAAALSPSADRAPAVRCAPAPAPARCATVSPPPQPHTTVNCSSGRAANSRSISSGTVCPIAVGCRRAGSPARGLHRCATQRVPPKIAAPTMPMPARMQPFSPTTATSP